MQPIPFKQQAGVLAESQPQYKPLPYYMGDGPEFITISCHQLTWRERFKLLFTGKLWHRQMTWGYPFQPMLLEVDTPWPGEKS